jgi:hypothetical protein
MPSYFPENEICIWSSIMPKMFAPPNSDRTWTSEQLSKTSVKPVSPDDDDHQKWHVCHHRTTATQAKKVDKRTPRTEFTGILSGMRSKWPDVTLL